MQEPVLTNFNVPSPIRFRFDEVCRASGRTRTSVLVELMEHYIFDQGNALEAKNRDIEKVDKILRKSRLLMSFEEFLRQTALTNGSFVSGSKIGCSQRRMSRPKPEITAAED